jgi:ADP-heptose:LPS heptosyltransferase
MLCDLLCPRRESLDVTIYVPADVQEEIDEYFEETFDGGKFVAAIHVPVEREEKRWPAEYFAELADALLADGRFDVLLTWGPGQLPMVENVVQRTRRHPVVAPETATLKHLAWLLHRADLYFGGDTGPMHIAAAMGTPVVAVFGGTDPAKHAPFRKPCEVLYVKGDGKGLDPRERLRRVTPDIAYDACVRLVTR